LPPELNSIGTPGNITLKLIMRQALLTRSELSRNEDLLKKKLEEKL
jgi:hypothetical protein